MIKKKIYSEFLQISKDMGLPVKKVLDVFFILSTGKSVENNELIHRVGVSKNVLNQVKRYFSRLLEPVSKNTQLTLVGLNQIKNLFKGEYTPEEQVWTFLEDSRYREIVDLLQGIQDKRPRPKRQYDQFTATLEITARRTSLLHFFGDIRDKKLLFLGDDDFTSVAAACIGGAEKIVAVDIDDQILNEIKSVSKGKQFGIETVRYDAREKSPKEFLGSFDIVFTDPPYTPEGIKLFVSRAIEFLDLNNKAARIYICYGNSDGAKERFLPIHEIFTQSGLMIRWVFDKFNRYHGAESIGSASSIFVLEVTPKTKPLVVGNYDKPIYTNI